MTDNQHNQHEPVILGAVRTPVGRLMGALASLSAPDLGAIVVREAIARTGIDPTQVDETIMGQVVQAGSGQAPARQASIRGGIPAEVGAITINKVCGSGLKAAMMAASAIKAGDGELYVTGGMESMSQAPFLVKQGRTGQTFGHMELSDSNITDGLWCAVEDWMMGNAAEFIADQFNITREEMDAFALESHHKALAAIDEGRFKEEIVPVEIRTRKSTTVVDTDEGPRRDTSMEALAKLPPAFTADGRVTAGNSPGLNDGAAVVVVASRAKAEEMGVRPLARIVAYGQAAVEPKWLFTAPAKAMPIVLDRAGWPVDEVDLIELNEAFAAQALANGREMAQKGHNWDWAKVNVNGGAVALGHPIGCSGARVLVTLLYALKARGLKRGMAALCLGGGEAVGMAVELEP
jgi:acetyl-CoA C-acetyltransferase